MPYTHGLQHGHDTTSTFCKDWGLPPMLSDIEWFRTEADRDRVAALHSTIPGSIVVLHTR
jgi:hypothetical protein